MSWNMNGAQRVPEESMLDRFAAEERVAQLVADELRLELVSFPRYSIVDRLLVMGGLASGWLEVKTRSTVFGHYPTYRVAREKLDDLRYLEHTTKTPSLLAVEWACGTVGLARSTDPVWKLTDDSAYLHTGRFRIVKGASW